MLLPDPFKDLFFCMLLQYHLGLKKRFLGESANLVPGILEIRQVKIPVEIAVKPGDVAEAVGPPL